MFADSAGEHHVTRTNLQIQFQTMNRRPAKRLKLLPINSVDVIKVNPPPKKRRTLKFINLNGKCMGEILKWLTLDDLYSVSCTCKTMQKLAAIQFQRDYPNNSISIEITADSAINSQFEGKYDLHFSASIQCYILTSHVFERDPSQLFNYLKMNGCRTLREIHMIRLQFKKRIDYGAIIQEQLQRLHTISFDRCSINDSYTQILKYCQHLKHLRIKERGYTSDWKQRVFRELKSLTIWGFDDEVHLNLRIFFALNRQLRNVNCMNIKVIESTLKFAENLDNIVIHCEDSEDFEEIAGLVKFYSQNNSIKRFELVFQFTNVDPDNDIIEWIDCLASLEAFQGFHCLFKIEELMIRPIPNLRTLSLKVVLEDEPLLWNLTQQLPRLECARIYICASTKRFGPNFKLLTMPFIMQLPKLKQLIVSFTSGSNVTHRSDLVELSKIRSNMCNAAACTIYLDSDIICMAKFIIPTNGMIQLKPISQLKRHLYLDPFLF